jgi:hypothetical protein
VHRGGGAAADVALATERRASRRSRCLEEVSSTSLSSISPSVFIGEEGERRLRAQQSHLLLRQL